MKHYIVGLTQREALGYAMRMKPEHKGHYVRAMTVDSVLSGGLNGLAGDDIEVSVLPRAWEHGASVSFAHRLGSLEEVGVRVVNVPVEA